MKEQSHKDEMSAALRGDFARLRDRGVAATLAPREGDLPRAVPIEGLTDSEPAAEIATEPEVETASEVETAPVAGEEPVARPGFFARILGH